VLLVGGGAGAIWANDVNASAQTANAVVNVLKMFVFFMIIELGGLNNSVFIFVKSNGS
jgi:hypothetical protein